MPPATTPSGAHEGCAQLAHTDRAPYPVPDVIADENIRRAAGRGLNGTTPRTYSVRGVVIPSVIDQPSKLSLPIRLRVREESSGMLGPIVVDMLALLM